MDEQMKESQVKELRESTGMSQGQFAEYYDLNVRTLQGWELGKRPPGGMVSMMKRILKQDAYILELESKLKGYEESTCNMDHAKNREPDETKNNDE